ncbi:MAG: adenylosuccinate lyase [Candidatus Binatia bacterium]|nr:MAG: adenylosuccinate lyase [Candidatus Binatia bacterium]
MLHNQPEDRLPDVLAERYASPEMAAIWSARGKVVLERELWIAVLKAQKELGLEVPDDAIAAYERVKDQVDLASIRARERRTKHDVKARIEEFCALAGHEHIHKGMTSRDLTENVEQLQILRAGTLLFEKGLAAAAWFAQRAQEYRDVVLPARTHNVPAQPTTFGRRLAMYGEELLLALDHLKWWLESYPLRGLKGPIGTQLDLLTLLGGDATKVERLENAVLEFLGFRRTLRAVGQVYPRSLDAAMAGILVQLGAAPSSFAKTLRLMAGHELATEGFAEGQVGSSAMPHKMNPRSCERLNGLHLVVRGFANMLEGLAGDQWNEGDVSCSVVRRVALPGIFLASDGLLETCLAIVKNFRLFPAVVAGEWRRHAPFLASTTLLMEAVRRGVGREQAHAIIQEETQAAVNALRTGQGVSDLVARLAARPELKLDQKTIESILDQTDRLVGAAQRQTDEFVRAVGELLARHPEAQRHQPRDIL